jgi:phage baseplate assembly protein W
MSKTIYLGSTLPLSRNRLGYFATTNDVLENEKSKFINLILTIKGERVANPTFGCDLWKLLFEQKTDNIQDLAEQYVTDAVNNFMPYLILRKILITNVDTFVSDNSINLYVQYAFKNNPLAVQSVQVAVGGNSAAHRALVLGNVVGELPQGSFVSSGKLSTR